MVIKLKNGATTAIAPVQPQVTETKGRMVLSAIGQRGKSQAEKIVLYACEGWGKTTWASKAEKPIFLSTEDGLKSVEIEAFPESQNWSDIFEAIETLRNESHNFKTLVIDTLDWSEHLCQAFLCKRDQKQSIEDYGYGKGYVISFEEWKRLITPLDALRKDKNMNIVLLAHSQIKTFNNPEGENYDRYEMKLDRRISALVKEWADSILFGSYDIAVDVKKGQTKGKGHGGDRVIYTTHSPAWDAKNRCGLPAMMTSDPAEYWKIIGGVK